MPPTPPAARGSGRLDSIDALRGLVMVIMALDHVRDFIHRGAMSASPTNLATTTPILFFTRWITHLCAPTFMLTAGLGAFFWWQRGRTRRDLSVFLLTRGLWLMLLEITVMRLAYNFDPTGHDPLLLVVLWVLGLCMVGLALLVWLPIPLLAGISLATIALHDTVDGVDAASLGGAAPLWHLLHQPGVVPLSGATVLVAYPLVPWIAVMALGFCLGPVLRLEPVRRRRRLITLGLTTTLAFLALRAVNHYGDPVPWSVQRSPIYTVLSFFNTTKYPPSLAFLLMTLGPALLLLAWFDRPASPRLRPLVVFGRVPLFYFVLHFYAAHAAAVLLAFARYGRAAAGFVFQPVPSMGAPAGLYPPDFGYDLWVAYLVWGAIVLGLYPVCRWFAGVKARRRDWWLGYL